MMPGQKVYLEAPIIKLADEKSLRWGLDKYFKTDEEKRSFLMALIGFWPVLSSIYRNDDGTIFIAELAHLEKKKQCQSKQ